MWGGVTMRNLAGLALAMLAFQVLGADVAPATPDNPLSADGLQRREGKWFEQVWTRRFYDIRSYRWIIYEAPRIEYAHDAPVDPTTSPTSANAVASTQQLTQQQKDSLAVIVTTAFRDQLGKSTYFELTTQPGPDVLILRSSLLDVVSFVPPDVAAVDDVEISDVGEATLTLELYDSLSDAIMVRVVGPVAAKHDTTSSATAADAVRHLAEIWATALRERIDSAASIPRDS